MTGQERMDRIAEIIGVTTELQIRRFQNLDIVEAKEDGQVIVQFAVPEGADTRGSILLDFEEMLKLKLDPSLTVWLEPLGDKNSLRNLRGIEVKS